jgi:hypothetical protein
MYPDEEALKREPGMERELWELQLEKERELREQLEREKAFWKQEEARRRRKGKWWMAIAAMLAIAVVACGVSWWITSSELSDARDNIAYLGTVLNYREEADTIPEPREFETKRQLEWWLAADDTDTNPEHLTQGELDCDDYALTLQKHALYDGVGGYFILNTQGVDYELVYDKSPEGNPFYIEGGYEYDSVTGANLGEVGDPDHMMNLTIIGNDVYLIEPQTDWITLWGRLD